MADKWGGSALSRLSELVLAQAVHGEEGEARAFEGAWAEGGMEGAWAEGGMEAAWAGGGMEAAWAEGGMEEAEAAWRGEPDAGEAPPPPPPPPHPAAAPPRAPPTVRSASESILGALRGHPKLRESGFAAFVGDLARGDAVLADGGVRAPPPGRPGPPARPGPPLSEEDFEAMYAAPAADP